MHDNRTHPLLQQLPLTVSPFVNLPTATTLPYRYKPMPSTLPPSTTGIAATAPSPLDDQHHPTADPNTPDAHGAAAGTTTNKPKYVISASGHAAHPDEILASCRALQDHVAQLRAQAEADLADLAERIRARELAEKRRVAPGWLDSEARLLEPERAATPASGGGGRGQEGVVEGASDGPGEMLLQQPVRGFEGGASEMAVPDEGEELDRAFGTLKFGTP
ncbi:hypothetical protein C8A01DRAFT_35972 [Parachaetomium inaequale]|uniref:Uncharacterized protein n=1 Tax=Parachaetomium inaequale TaxID=2588326 RepID=A0AAN6PIZ1_9PEZI|nr:hypothetical protein C8A01DRAFT_35972 [Parachaetomium inaequale]